MRVKNYKGDALLDVILFTGIILFLIMPVFSFTLEKYIYQNSIQIIKDSLDMTAIAAYKSLNENSTSRNNIEFDATELLKTYKKYLAENMRLNNDLSPKENSIAKNTVRIEQLEIYTSGFPLNCPSGIEIDKVTIHTLLTIPVKPNLFRRIVLDIMGKENVELKIHQDTEIPVDD